MKDWVITVPYLLPRISSVKKNRNNTMPVKFYKPCSKSPHISGFGSRSLSWQHSDPFYPGMIPDPDYSESESQEESDEEESEENEDESEYSSASERLQNIDEEEFKKRTTTRGHKDQSQMRENFLMNSRNRRNHNNSILRSTTSQTSEEDLIKPKKPTNPYLESMERKNLHKELVFKQKHGQNTMNQRSELQRALEKYSESKVKKDLASSRRSSLEKILERQARKIEMQEREGIMDVPPSWIDRLKQQHVTKRTGTTEDEFYRVHAMVVGNSLHSHSAEDGSVHSSESITKIDSSLPYSEN